MSDQHDLEALNALVADPDLEKLTDLVSEFNLFEALGVVRQELRHSNFLAWLLNPSENHGLGDYALRKFVMLVIKDHPTLTPADISTWDFSQALVQTEVATSQQRRIDILIAHPKRDYVIVIENKTWTREHSGQLSAYYQFVSENYPAAQKIFILLSPYGIRAEDEDLGYLAVEYALLEKLIREILTTKTVYLAQDVLVFLTHYSMMLRRNFMAETETVELARQIYAHHRHALDFIFNHKPDRISNIFSYIVENFIDSQRFEVGNRWANRVNLSRASWKFTKTYGVYVVFQHQNNGWDLLIELYKPNRELYEHLVQVATKGGITVKPYEDMGHDKGLVIAKYPLIHPYEYLNTDLVILYENINTFWNNQFQFNYFPKWDQIIQQAIREYREDVS